MYILHIPSWFPDEENAFRGNFIEKHIDAISQFYPSVTLKVVKKNQFDSPRLIEKKGNNIIVTYFYKTKRSFIGRIWNRFNRKYRYQKMAKEILHQYGKPSLIHLHVALPMGIFAKELSQKWNIPLVLTEHWSIYHEQNYTNLKPALAKKIASVYSNLDGFTAVSENLRRRISYLFPNIKSCVIHNVVNMKLFLPGQVANGKKNIVHISTLNEEAKNITGLLNGIKLLSELRDDFILKIIHESRNENAETFVRENGLTEQVLFLGSKTEEEVAEELQKSDFLLLFSNYENLPCVIIESFACGKPVISTDVGGISEIVDKERGILVKAKDEKELVAQLHYMLDHSDQYHSEKIRKYATEHFAPEVIGKQFADFYKEILSEFSRAT